jgi:hypothetical protein
MDGDFTFLHRARVLLDVVSEDWAKDKLPEEDILVRKDIHGMLEVDEDRLFGAKVEEEIWTDLDHTAFDQ